ncbi:MAG: hypothetical protein NVS3B25_32310 [Hymenobacter sp.]
MTLNPEHQVVATLTIDADGNVLSVQSGRQGMALLYQADVYITERMLMDMNAMMRAKWEQVKREITLDRHKPMYPATPDECQP